MERRHTAWPWRIGAMEGGYVTIEDADGREFTGWLLEEDGLRIVACVNACRGLSTDELERFGLASAFGTELIELEKQRDQLLAALERCKFDSLNMSLEDLEFCCSAIAAVKGGAAC